MYEFVNLLSNVSICLQLCQQVEKIIHFSKNVVNKLTKLYILFEQICQFVDNSVNLS